MSQNARDRVIADFRAGRVPVLLATNVSARGLDVLSIEQVINFEMPESAELFTHRVGRTGRMEREGEAITLVTPDDLPTWKRMQRDLGANMPARAWPQDEMPLPPAAIAPATPQAAHPTPAARSAPRFGREARHERPPQPAPARAAEQPARPRRRFGGFGRGEGGPRRGW